MGSILDKATNEKQPYIYTSIYTYIYVNMYTYSYIYLHIYIYICTCAEVFH